MYNAEAQSAPATAEQIVDAIDRPNTTPTNAALYSRLGTPKAGRLLIPERIPHARRVTLSKTDPEEALQRYVVLTYPNSVVAAVMKEKLSRDSNVIWVGENGYWEYSATPSDPLFPWASYYWYYGITPKDRQWGMNSLSLDTAWDKVRGHAYLGHVDSGIQLGHPDLANLSQPWLTNFRVQFSVNYSNLNTTSVDENSSWSSYLGHGTHTAGIMAAATNNSQGVAGTCWNCSLLVAKIAPTSLPNDTSVIQGVQWMISRGAQAINLSLGASFSRNCSIDPNEPFCQALTFATNRDVVVVGASGNYEVEPPQFPASDSRVIAVGGIDSNGGIWSETNPIYRNNTDGNSVLRGSNYGANQTVVAPARDVLSTVYTSRDWNPYRRCGDSNAFYYSESGGTAGAGYGICTGTSMAAPHVTGIVGLLRSVNPLLTRDQIKNYLISYANRYPSWDSRWGYGVPNANASVTATQSTNNRLTPLFSLYGSYQENYFYTTAPQMGIAAVTGNLLPTADVFFNTYNSIGTWISSYTSFPGGTSQPPRAQTWIFTTHINPFSPSYELVPLYRLSYKCGDGGVYNPVCSRNFRHVDHTYTTEIAGVQAYASVGYKLDGIEGYIYPKYLSPQSGMVRLMRKYNSYRDDHAIFPESELNYMIGQGYTQNSGNTDWIGYVYPNYGYRPY